MPNLRLHLDADTSSKGLLDSLQRRGHDVTRTPCAWMRMDATDEEQLLGSTTHGRCIFTFDARDFVPLSQRYPQHAGIILASQNTWLLGDLVDALDRLLASSEATDWIGQVRWLNDWKREA